MITEPEIKWRCLAKVDTNNIVGKLIRVRRINREDVVGQAYYCDINNLHIAQNEIDGAQCSAGNISRAGKDIRANYLYSFCLTKFHDAGVQLFQSFHGLSGIKEVEIEVTNDEK